MQAQAKLFVIQAQVRQSEEALSHAQAQIHKDSAMIIDLYQRHKRV